VILPHSLLNKKSGNTHWSQTLYHILWMRFLKRIDMFHCPYLRNALGLIIVLLLNIDLGQAQIVSKILVNTKSDAYPTVVFDYWVSQRNMETNQVLLLIPGYNGSGPAMITPQWKILPENITSFFFLQLFQHLRKN
jgi:hypothetical protein